MRHASTRHPSTIYPIAMALFVTLVLGTVTDGFAQSRSMTTSRKKITPDPEQENRIPRALRNIGWDQNIGQSINQSASFVDHNGKAVTLGDFIGERPVILAPVYYDCPMLCSLVLDGIVRGLKPLKFSTGQDFEVVAVSFDSRETPELAKKARATSLARYGKQDETAVSGGWNYLVGEDEMIDALMKEIGFRYEWDERTEQFAHAGGVVLLTPDGKISRYFYGVDYAPRDLRLGLIEASENKLGSVIDQVLLYCYQYDPATGKYSAVAMNMIRLGGAITVFLLALFIGRSIFKERRERKEPKLA